MRPEFIKPNSTIYLIAPSFGCTTAPYEERLLAAIENFKKLGHKVIIGPNCFINEGFLASNTPEKRAQEFMDAYLSNADCIISVGGGETMCDILPFVDFEIIKKAKPKWFVGFSDNTNLTYTLTTICNVETIYGNNAPNYFAYPLDYEALDTYNMLLGANIFKGYDKWQLSTALENPYSRYEFNKTKKIIPINYNKPFSGIMLGGCLDVITALCGTKFDNTINYIDQHQETGIIFYLEACDLNSLGIRRALFQLINANYFKFVKGFLIGRSFHYEEAICDITPNDSYIDMLSSFNVPLLLDVDLGHLPPSLPMRNGSFATVEIKNNNIVIEYKK